MISETKLYETEMQDVFFDTVFLGGGTPSLIDGADFFSFIEKIRRILKITENAEFTLECNPGTLNTEKLLGYKNAGVNRVSLGLQSAEDKLLKRIGRIHTYSDFEDSVKKLKKTGYGNFNVDVMHGLPGQDISSYLDTLKKVIDTGATHVSSYSLILEEGTPLYSDVMNHREMLPDDDLVADMQDAGIAFLLKNGFERYEISNFAKKGYRCRHNENYWKNGEYLGLGPAAHSAFYRNKWTRWSNVPFVSEYRTFLNRCGFPVRDIQEIPEEEEMFECIMLGLRTADGVSMERFKKRFNRSLRSQYDDAIKKCIGNGWVHTDRLELGYLALNKKGMDLENLVLENFMEG